MSDWTRRGLLALLCFDAAVLAVIELMYLPLRLDGEVLPDLGGVPFPITAVLAALTTPMLVSWATRLGSRVSVAGAPLFTWFAALVVLGLFGAGGDEVLIADWRTLLLLAGGALPSAVVLGGALGRSINTGAGGQPGA